MRREDQSRPRVTVVGGDALVRDVLEHLLVEAGLELAADAQVVLLAAPDQPAWLEAEQHDLPIVVVTPEPLPPEAAVTAVLCGADALVDFDCAPEQLAAAVATVIAGEVVLEAHHVASLARAFRRHRRCERGVQLTGREREILACIEEGQSVKQTARSLGIAPKTVENLQSRLFAKLGARNRAQAIARSHALGVV